MELIPPSEKQPKRGRRLPDDWTLPTAWAAWAAAERPGLDLRRVEEEFRDWWIAQPGQRGVKANWEATWRTWVRRTEVRGQTGARQGGYNQGQAEDSLFAGTSAVRRHDAAGTRGGDR